MDTIALEERTLARRLSASAERFPVKVACRAVSGGELTYAGLDRESNRLAHGLAAFGVSAQEPLLVMLSDTLLFCRPADRLHAPQRREHLLYGSRG